VSFLETFIKVLLKVFYMQDQRAKMRAAQLAKKREEADSALETLTAENQEAVLERLSTHYDTLDDSLLQEAAQAELDEIDYLTDIGKYHPDSIIDAIKYVRDMAQEKTEGVSMTRGLAYVGLTAVGLCILGTVALGVVDILTSKKTVVPPEPEIIMVEPAVNHFDQVSSLYDEAKLSLLESSVVYDHVMEDIFEARRIAQGNGLEELVVLKEGELAQIAYDKAERGITETEYGGPIPSIYDDHLDLARQLVRENGLDEIQVEREGQFARHTYDFVTEKAKEGHLVGIYDEELEFARLIVTSLELSDLEIEKEKGLTEALYSSCMDSLDEFGTHAIDEEVNMARTIVEKYGFDDLQKEWELKISMKIYNSHAHGTLPPLPDRIGKDLAFGKDLASKAGDSDLVKKYDRLERRSLEFWND